MLSTVYTQRIAVIIIVACWLPAACPHCITCYAQVTFLGWKPLNHFPLFEHHFTFLSEFILVMELSVFILRIFSMLLVRTGNTEISKGLGVHHPSKIPTKIYRLMALPAFRVTIRREFGYIKVLPHTLASVMPAVGT